MMEEIKYFDENLVSLIILGMDLTNDIEHIYYKGEFVDRIGKARKEYRLKFKDEEDECMVWLTDIPYKIVDGYAHYEVLFQTVFGRFYAHDVKELNSYEFPTEYSDLETYMEDYNKRPSKEVEKL